MASRVYRLMLFLLPKAFRLEYGDEMAAVFADRRRQADWRSRWWLWLEVLLDIVVTAAREHLDILRRDLRCAARTFRRSPGYAAIAVLTMTLGIGANTAIFTLVDHTLVRSLPFEDPDRLVKVWERAPLYGYTEVQPTPGNYVDWVAQNQVFASMAAYTSTVRNLTGSGMPERLQGCQTTSGLLPLLGIQPAFGRGLTAADDAYDAPHVILLSHGLWQRRFGGARDIVGSELLLDGIPHEVVGVMPATFHFPSTDVDFWIPLRFTEEQWADRTNHYLEVLARFGDGVTPALAQADLDVIARRLDAEYPETNRDSSIFFRSLHNEVSRSSRSALILLSLAALGVLAIGCANLANLLLARATDRRREMAVRRVLGAGKESLVRQLLTENLVLSSTGGVLGIVTAFLCLPLLGHLVPGSVPIDKALHLDGRVLAFAAALSILTGLAFALYPVWKVSRGATTEALREGNREGVGGRKSQVRNALVVAEVAISVVLLIGTGLLIKALLRISHLDPGFRTEQVLTLRTSLPLPRYQERDDRQLFYDQVLTRVRALPGVRDAGYAGFLPFVMRGIVWPVGVEGDPDADKPPVPNAVFRVITRGYLETMDLPILRGRGFGFQDTAESPPMAVVSESFAKRLWPDRDPVGLRFEFLWPWMEDVYTVAGVVTDIKARGLERRTMPQVYVLHAQAPGYLTHHAPKDLAVYADGDLESLVPALRRVIAEVDEEQPISDIRTMAALVASETTDRRYQLRLLGAFAALAFAMAALGIYGVLSYLISQRSQEIGVRMALGARVGQVTTMVLGTGLRLAAVGIVLGLGGGVLLGGTLRHLLFGVVPFDPSVIAWSVALCLTACVAACSLPAWRAARIDPITALRLD